MRRPPVPIRRPSHLRLVDGAASAAPFLTMGEVALSSMSEDERQRHVQVLLQQADSIGSIAVEVAVLDQPALVAQINLGGDLFAMFLGASNAVRLNLQALTDIVGTAHSRIVVAFAASTPPGRGG